MGQSILCRFPDVYLKPMINSTWLTLMPLIKLFLHSWVARISLLSKIFWARLYTFGSQIVLLGRTLTNMVKLFQMKQ